MPETVTMKDIEQNPIYALGYIDGLRVGKKEVTDIAVKLSDKIELEGQISLEEWKAFKKFRNTLFDQLNNNLDHKETE